MDESVFDKLMNSYYYGKSGKGDYTPEDLPKNRWQLFWEMLRVRMSGLCRLNLMYFLPWLPAIAVLMIGLMSALSGIDVSEAAQTAEVAAQNASLVQSVTWMTLLLLIPCLLITGPFTAGVAYVTRNWARDEHAFIWSDFKDAVKENWKPSLVISAITSVVPILAYMCWTFYGQLSVNQPLMVIPQMLTMMLAALWSFAVTYTYPMIVTYRMNLRAVLRNSFILAIARLPMSVGIRLLHCVPLFIAYLLMMATGSAWVLIGIFAYYLVFGFGLSRFITASYTNAVFDKYINSRIEGAQVNRGLAEQDDDDEDEEDEEDSEERELKPWENGYTNPENWE